MAERRQTALGVARARFVEGLPRKAREVRASLALLAGTPDEDRPREELRRRLHALYASAQVFRLEPLAAALRDALAGIDSVNESRRGFSQEELDRLATLAATLPALGDSDAQTETASVEMESVLPPPAELPTIVPEPQPEKKKRTRKKKEEEPRASAAPKPKPKTQSGLETVLSVLVVDEPEQQARVRAALPPERFEVLTAADADEALRLARSSAPDLILADRAIVLRPGVDLIGKLRDDPLTDFVPVVLLLPAGAPLDPVAVREAGADDALVKPLDAQTVLATVERTTARMGPTGATTLTGDLTLEEVADRIAEEVKRGIVDAAEKGKDLAVPMGDGTPLMAAAWSAIGRVRAHLAERSGGRVRFREAPARGGPAFVVLGDETDDEEVGWRTEEGATEILETFNLTGRRVLIVDDDPAVVWFFAGLLREHGADVVESADGVDALEDARRHRPDIVISDVLMPRLDGFGLTRAFKRDPMLADVPVILISWKEDLLSRMRELKAGASGYLRKEAAAGHILTAVRDVLRPRVRLESRLRAGGDVRGRLEDVGLSTLLTTVAKIRPDARLTLRASWSLFELEVRDGELVDVNRTASDGAFTRGPRVFETMLGMTAARYTVADSQVPIRRSVTETLTEMLAAGMSKLAARIDAVSGKNLAKAAEVELDDELVESVLRSSPEEMERVVEQLKKEGGPRRLIMEGLVAPNVLEQVLIDLARQGAIRKVIGPDGEDRILLARTLREKGLHPELSEHEEKGTLSWLPPKSAATTEELVIAAELAAIAALSDPPSPIDPMDLDALAPPPLPTYDLLPLADLEPPKDDEPELPMLGPPFMPVSTPSAPPLSALALIGEEPELWWDDDEEGLDDEGLDDEGLDDEELDDEERSDHEPFDDERLDEEKNEADAADEADADEEHAQVLSTELHAIVPPAPTLNEESTLPEPFASPILEETTIRDEGPSEPPEQAEPFELRIPPPPKLVTEEGSASALHVEAPPPVAKQARPASTMGIWVVGWVLGLMALVAIGFVGMRLLSSADPEEPVGPIPPDERTTGAPPVPTQPVQPTQPVRTNEPTVEAPVPQQATGLPAAYGREEDGIATVDGVSVAAGQGLVVLEPASGGAPMQVHLGERELSVANQRVGLALAPGVHHLTFVRGDHQDFVWIAVRAGKTRYIPPLP